MVANSQQSRMAPTEYLEWEPLQEFHHEYVDGKIFAVVAESPGHSLIAKNLHDVLNAQLGEGFKVCSGNARVQISPTGPFYYPDVFVTCDRQDQLGDQFFRYPSVIMEVISAQTENRDRGIKFAHYRRLASLREFVLVQSEQIGVECFRKNEQGTWFYQPYEAGSTLTLESVGFSCLIDILYAA